MCHDTQSMSARDGTQGSEHARQALAPLTLTPSLLVGSSLEDLIPAVSVSWLYNVIAMCPHICVPVWWVQKTTLAAIFQVPLFLRQGVLLVRNSPRKLSCQRSTCLLLPGAGLRLSSILLDLFFFSLICVLGIELMLSRQVLYLSRLLLQLCAVSYQRDGTEDSWDLCALSAFWHRISASNSDLSTSASPVMGWEACTTKFGSSLRYCSQLPMNICHL